MLAIFERHNFYVEFKERLEKLQSIEESIENDDLLTKKVLEALDKELDLIDNSYSRILKHSKKSIKNLRKNMDICYSIIRRGEQIDDSVKRELLKHLRKAISDLNAEKETI